MKPAICIGCGKDCGEVPDEAEEVTCFDCCVKEARGNRFISRSCEGERCSMCKAPAEHKVAEEIQFDDPLPARHELTAYVCHECFVEIMGRAAL